MTSTAVVRRPGGKTTDANGFEVDGWATVYVNVPCWVDNAGPSAGTRTSKIGDIEVQLATRVLKVPHDTTDLRDGDLAQIIGGACDGRFFRIIEATAADQKKQQELPVVETTEPSGWSV